MAFKVFRSTQSSAHGSTSASDTYLAPDHPYGAALLAAFGFAHEVGTQSAGPVHLLAGIVRSESVRAITLDGTKIIETLASNPRLSARPDRYQGLQVQSTALRLAEETGTEPSPYHLLIVLLDQGSREFDTLMDLADIDRLQLRQESLQRLGLPPDLACVVLEKIGPAGIAQTPLSTLDLDPDVWAILSWRAEHLPIDKLRDSSDYHALLEYEKNAAWRLVDRAHLDDDQRFSLLSHHLRNVAERVKDLQPRVVAEKAPPRPQNLAVSDREWRDGVRTSSTSNVVTCLEWIRIGVRSSMIQYAADCRDWRDGLFVSVRARKFAFRVRHNYADQPSLPSPSGAGRRIRRMSHRS